MVIPYMKQQTKPAKNNGKMTFTNFSEGLYLLDTPRGVGEQLASLAMVGGRNVFSEKGALIPQNGYDVLATLPNNAKVVGVTKDSKSFASVYILTMLGQVYYYSPDSGVKQYKTEFESLTNDVLYTRINDNVVTYDGGDTHIFGDYYPEAPYIEICPDAKCYTYGTWAQFNIDSAYSKYFWRNKKIAIKGYGGGKITAIQNSTKEVATAVAYSYLDPKATWRLEGDITVDSTNSSIDIDTTTGWNVQVQSTEHTQEGGKVTKKTLKWACYRFQLYDTAIKYSTLSLPSEGYFYTQYDPARLRQFMQFAGANQAKLASSANEITQTHFHTELIDHAGVLIGQLDFYPWVSAVNGTKATSFCFSMDGKTMGDGRVGNLTRYERGDFYNTTQEDAPSTTYTTRAITFTVPLSDGSRQVTTTDLDDGSYRWCIENIYDESTASGVLYASLYLDSTLVWKKAVDTTGKELLCRKNDPEGEIRAGIAELYIGSKSEPENISEVGSILITVVPYSEDAKFEDIPKLGVSVGEQAMTDTQLKYIPEESSEKEVGLIPTLIGGSAGRLLVVNTDGNIYYSALGVLDDFNESDGAGYFSGFYGDSSEVLDFDDYLDNVLIVKQNGLYLATISDSTLSSSSVSLSSESGLQITKISNIGQQYASDHVVIDKNVYAYDSNAHAFVLAASQNYLGTMNTTQTLIPSEYFDTLNLTISSSKRYLVFDQSTKTFILYYGDNLIDGIVITQTGNLFPRRLNKGVDFFVDCASSIIGIGSDNTVFQDYKKNTVIPEVEPVAEFEPIALLGNKMTCASLLEVAELNGIKYAITCSNISTSYQQITPYTNYGIDGVELPPLLYSNDKYQYELFGVLPEEEEETLKELLMQKQVTKWARKKSNCTRVYAPMSGREGVSISLTFQANVAFCLAAITIVDFSQGE